MNIYLVIIVGWIVYALIRALLFKKLEIKAVYSIVPGYGTYLLCKKVWEVKWFWIYIISLIAVAFIQNYLIPDMTTAVLFYFFVIFVVSGWTGQAFYTARELKQNPILGYGLAILYPIFGLIIGLKKDKAEVSLESE